MTRAETDTMTLPRELLEAFSRAFPNQAPDVFVRAPGRVNLLGGHVDIHGGPVINITIDRGIWVAAAYGASDLVRLHAADLGEETTFSLGRLDEHCDVVGEDLPRWALYPAGVAWGLQKRGLKVNGINVAFLGNLAMRAGLSSSAAVEEAFAVAWQALEGLRLDMVEMAELGQQVEREYMGLSTGIQDQFTCLHGRADHALWLDCRTLDFCYPVLPRSARVVICDTGTRRELGRSNYGGRAGDAHEAAHTIRMLDKRVKTLRDVSPERLEDFRGVLTDDQYRRARHVVTEIARVASGLEALEDGDMAGFGALMNQSYWSARDDYGSSSPALDVMWDAAHDHPACYGARYSGGGEAGAVVALVERAAVDDFIATVSVAYERRSGHAGNLLAVDPAPGAGVFL